MLIFLISLLCCQPLQQIQKDSSTNILFWNLENFFDYKDSGSGESDKEFSSFGSRHWTKKRFQAKCHAVAKSIYWIKDTYGSLPAVIGLAEIENKNVLYRLLNDTALKKTDYAFVHFDGPDRRGIDVALLYRKSIMEINSITRKQPLYPNGDSLYTRDILHVHIKLKNGHTDTLSYDFIVNHHPSKFGGEKESKPKREAAMITLSKLCDSLNSIAPRNIIAMGDFNDNPSSETFFPIQNTLNNPALDLHQKGEGSIRYEGKWDLIDMFLLSPGIKAKMEILKIPFLMVRDSKHPGEKPLRTYSGPKYLGGISDHCPILLKIY